MKQKKDEGEEEFFETDTNIIAKSERGGKIVDRAIVTLIVRLFKFHET